MMPDPAVVRRPLDTDYMLHLQRVTPPKAELQTRHRRRQRQNTAGFKEIGREYPRDGAASPRGLP
jgi:hypothetical protein